MLRKELKEGDKFLVFNSILKLFPGKLRSRWSRPMIVTLVTPHGAIEVKSKDGQEFKGNGQRLKHYFGQQIDAEKVFYIAS